MRRKETLPFAKTWMDLEGITLSKISQIKTNTYMWNIYIYIFMYKYIFKHIYIYI